MEKKQYIIPTMKFVNPVGESLMVNINEGSITDDFEEGAKGMNFEDDAENDAIGHPKSVWED